MTQRSARIVVIATLAAALLGAALLLVALLPAPVRTPEPQAERAEVALDREAARQAWADARALSLASAD
jgi:hypothetical protein